MTIANQAICLLETLRPKQWIKNIFIFAGIIFAQQLFIPEIFAKVLLGFILFCLGSGSIYLLNDLMDIEKDKIHPQKAKRPLASGRLSKRVAFLAATIMMILVIPFSFYLDRGYGLLLLTYLIMNILYSLKLKNVVIIDVMIIAAGFVVRVLAGCSLASVAPSDWLIISTIAISLFLGFSKRREEVLLMANSENSTRKVLEHYSREFLDQMIAIVTGIAILSYILYALSEKTIARFGTSNLVFTVPFVLFGMFRYLYLIYQKGGGGDPTNTFFKDWPFLINAFLWGISILLIIYVW